MRRQILHVDMDAFFAAVEQRDRPELRGKPLLVGGSPEGRGVVATASYEARAFGARSAMPMATALRLCPHAIRVPVRMARYREVSAQVFGVFEEFTPVVEPISVDEAFLDMTGTRELFGEPEEAARRLKARIRDVTGLTASVGVAASKFLAKLASDLRKPDGLVVVPDSAQELLDPLPVSRLWGAGPAAVRRLERMGARTVADVRRLPRERLVAGFGAAGEQFYRLARGQDERPVLPDREAKSISHEVTFAQDVDDLDHLRAVLLHQVEDVGYRLRRQELCTRTLSLKLRYPDFTTLTRAATLPEPAQATDTLWQTAAALFDAWASERRGPLRLIGAAASGLCRPEGRQLSLFAGPDSRSRRLDAALDALRARFGPDAVRRGGRHP